MPAANTNTPNRPHKSRAALTAVPLLLAYPRPSVTPRIHPRLPCDIRHGDSRYRPGNFHRHGGRGGTIYGSHGQVAAGDLVDDTFNKRPGRIQGERRAEIDRASAVDPECYAGFGVKKINTKSAIMVTQIYPTEPNIKIVPDKR